MLPKTILHQGGVSMDAGRYISARKARDEAIKLQQGLPLLHEVDYLSEEYAKGRVKKTTYLKANPKRTGDLTEMAILELDPGAEILQHQHTDDMEYYIDNDNHISSVCNCGEWHGYKNETDEVVSIISLKFAVFKQ